MAYSRLHKLAFNSIHWHLFLPLAGSCRSGWQHHRAGGRRGRVDLLRWLGGRAGGHPVPRPRPAERPSGRGKHTQSTWPDLDLNPDSHNRTRALHTHGTPTKKKQKKRSCTHVFTHLHIACSCSVWLRNIQSAIQCVCDSVRVCVCMTHKMIFVHYTYNQEYISRMHPG